MIMQNKELMCFINTNKQTLCGNTLLKCLLTIRCNILEVCY